MPKNSLVLFALLSTATFLACDEDPLGPEGTGRMVLRIVPLEEAEPAKASQSGGTESANPGRTESVTAKTGDSLAVVDTGSTSDEVLAQVAAPQVPRRDILRVIIQGPTNFSQDYPPNADGSLDVTIPDLATGSYTVQVWGMDTDLGGQLVSEFGTTSGVTVQEDQTTTASIPFGSFLPDIDPTIQTTTSAFRFEIGYRRVPTATGYFTEVDTDPGFSAPNTFSHADTAVVLSVPALGTYYFRVRAENNMVSASEAKPSDPVTFDVVADLGGPTGDDAGSAMFLGTVNAATGTYGDFNIYPATDEDWFALDLTTDATLSVEVLSVSLTQPALELASPEGVASPSDLDPYLEIFDPGINLIASNDDDVTEEPRITDLAISTDGTHYIRVTSWNQASVGHYELNVTVNAPAVARVDVTPPTATIVPTGQVQLTGRTFDQFDVELFDREAIWSSSDDFIATVDGTGLVTGQSLGTATITLESEGIQGTATIDVTNIPAAKVVITPNSGLLQGIGQTVLWSAEAFDAGDNPIPGKPINWWGANPSVADADAGLVEAFGNGQTFIVAEADGVEGYAVITVTDPSATPVNYWADGPASGTTENLLDMWGANASSIWTVGNNGTILFNNGSGWSAQTSGTGAALTGVWGVDDFEVWTVGSGGTILVTYDQGATWNPEVSGTGEWLVGVWGAAPDDVFAVGGIGGAGTVLHYDGTSWTTMTIPVTITTALRGVWGTASDNVFAVGDAGVILHYDGVSWTQMTSFTSENLRRVWGAADNDVFAVGTNGTIRHYDGFNWTSMTSGTIQFLRDVWGTSDTDVTAVGGAGTVLRYDGASWNSQFSGTTESLAAVWGSPNPGVFTVGNLGTVRLGIRGATAEITASPLSILSDGISTSTITVQAMDAGGTNLTSGGANVTLATDAGTLSTVTDNADGTYTATLTSSITVETATITGTMNSGAIADDATVRFTTASAAQSTITGSPTSIPADGASTSTITVQVKDGSGTPLTVGGEDVTLSTDLGTLSAVTDMGDGTYTATLTAGTTTGFATISGDVWGQAMSDAIVTFRGTAPPDLIGSTAGGGGTNPSALYSIDRTTGAATPIGMIGFNRVGAMDLHPATGVLYAAAERASDATPVLITIDQTTGVGTEIGPTGVPGGISDLSFHSSGTLYGHEATPGTHALHTFDLVTGAATQVGLTSISGGGNGLTFNATNSLFLAASQTLYALSTSTGTGPALGGLTWGDPRCNRIKALDRDPVSELFYVALECGATDDLGTLDITSGSVTTLVTMVADLDGLVVPTTSTAPTTGPASELFTTISTFNNNIVADGVATAAISVNATDATNTRLTVGGDHLALSTTLGTLSAVTDNGDGTYSATLTSSTTAGTATVSGTINGVAISSTQGITSIALLGSAFTSGGPGSGVFGAATLYWIDPATGGAGVLGAIGFERVGAIAKHPSTGVFYAAAQRPAPDGTPVLITVDPVTGAGTEIGPTGVGGSVTDISFHSDGTLYLFDGPRGGYNLHTVDLVTGAATLVGSTGLGGGGLGMWFDAADVLHIATTSLPTTSLYSISTSTAAPTLVGTFTYAGAACSDPVINAVDRDPLSSAFYASVRCSGSATHSLGSIDMGTLIVTVIGGTTTGLDGVASRR